MKFMECICLYTHSFHHSSLHCYAIQNASAVWLSPPRFAPFFQLCKINDLFVPYAKYTILIILKMNRYKLYDLKNCRNVRCIMPS